MVLRLLRARQAGESTRAHCPAENSRCCGGMGEALLLRREVRWAASEPLMPEFYEGEYVALVDLPTREKEELDQRTRPGLTFYKRLRDGSECSRRKTGTQITSW